MNKVHTAYDIAAPCVITPASPLNPLQQLVGYIPQVQGSSGNLTFNDCATLEEASVENQIQSFEYNAAWGAAGIGATLNYPIERGLVVSSVPTGMVLNVQYAIYVPG